MNLKFYDDAGNEIRVNHPGQFAVMVRAGRVQPHTMIYDEDRAVWQVASEFPEFKDALSGAQGDYNQGAPSYSIPPDASAAANPASPFASQAPYVPFTPTEPQRKRSKVLIIALVVILVGVIAAVFSFTRIKESKAERMAEQDIASIMKDILDGRTIEARNYDEKTYGKLTGLVQAMNDYVVGMQNDMQNMNKEMTELGLETVLTEQGLKNAQTIASSREKMQRFRKMLDRYEAQTLQRTLDLPEKVQKMDVDERVKREFIAGFNASKDEGIKNMSEFFSIERSFATKSEEIFDFLDKRQGRYKWISSIVYFDTPGEEIGYNRLIEDIQKIAEQEEEWKRNTNRRLQQRYDRMQKR